MKFDEHKFVEELWRLGYHYELDYDEDTGELTGVNIYPKHFDEVDETYEVDYDVIYLLYENGFKIDRVVFGDDTTEGFVSFYRESDEE